jgi:hypothetical protein
MKILTPLTKRFVNTLPATFAAAPAMRIYCAQFGRRKRSAPARQRGADLFYDPSTFSGGRRRVFQLGSHRLRATTNLFRSGLKSAEVLFPPIL